MTGKDLPKIPIFVLQVIRVVVCFFYIIIGILSLYQDENEVRILQLFMLTSLHLWATVIMIICSFFVGKKVILYTHRILYCVNLPISIIVCGLYWSLVHNSNVQGLDLFITCITHGFTVVYSVFELCFNEFQVTPFAPLVSLFLAILYVSWAWIGTYITKKPPYTIMMEDSGRYIFNFGAPSVCVLLCWLNVYAHRIKKYL